MDSTLYELNDVLFKQLHRLSNDNLRGEALAEEIKRTDSISDISKNIIANAELCLRAQIAQSDKLACNQPLPAMLESKK